MLFNDIITDYLPFLPDVPGGGMIYYLQTQASLRGRTHQNTFWMTFNGGEKSVFDFFVEMNRNVMFPLAGMQSWEVFTYGYFFVKVFPPPYVIQFIPLLLPGFWVEPACLNKELAVINLWTEQSGPKSRARKYLFGMPASWIDGPRLTPDGGSHIFGYSQIWYDLFMSNNPDSPYTMGLMHRYVDGSYHSPLNPINYWPFNRFQVRTALVKHRHWNASKRHR